MFNIYMKKTLLIIVLSMFLGGNAYAKTTFIKCTKDSGYQRTFIFEINDRKKDIKLVDGIGVDEDKKTINGFSKNSIDLEYDGIITYNLDENNKMVPNKEQYISILISRMTGQMHYIMNERNNDKMVTMEKFTCKKAEPIF